MPIVFEKKNNFGPGDSIISSPGVHIPRIGLMRWTGGKYQHEITPNLAHYAMRGVQ